MAENRGTRADLPPGGGLDEIKYEPAYVNPLDTDFENTGEGDDELIERAGDGTHS